MARLAVFAILALAVPHAALAQAPQTPLSSEGLALYESFQRFQLTGGSAAAEHAVLKRDRVEMVFDGTFYFEPPLAGRVRGAVFLGKGTVHADVPPGSLERENLQRILHADAVDSDFKLAVLRFTDDSLEALNVRIRPGQAAPEEAQKAASELSVQLLKDVGANLPARMVVSILNAEAPGVFFAQFDKGKRGRFRFLWDYQGRLLVAHFGLNGGERGLFFAYDLDIFSSDIWMAFWALEDYEKKRGEYSDLHELVDLQRYDMDVDLRDWKRVRIRVRMTMVAKRDGVRAVPLMLNQTLGNYADRRLKKAIRVKAAQAESGDPLTAIQADWDGSVTLLLPSPLSKGQKIQPVLDLEGDFLIGDEMESRPIRYVSADCWYPQHGDLHRSQFDFTFRHKKGTRVASIGQRVREEQAPDGGMVTEWRMEIPVFLATFAVGEFELHTSKAALETGGDLPLDLYTYPEQMIGQFALSPDYLLAELSNTLRYYSKIFGPYPYPRFGATIHPFNFGQGFPSMLLIPRIQFINKFTYSFTAHETSHQWWGDVVTWRSYRDQWLSEGFAEYSGVLYTGLRDKNKSYPRDILRYMRDELLLPPRTLSGIGKGRVVDIGPLILGRRLFTRESLQAYYTLTYRKGGWVLRMLHFLFTDPVTGDSEPFFAMMRDFVHRYANRPASTEDFQAVASEHFVRTPIARKFKLTDLNWFFYQWVYQAYLPSYHLSYQIDRQTPGVDVINGTVQQDRAPNTWFMPLPLVITLPDGKEARGTVHALGPSTPFTIKIPGHVDRVELDPDGWILSEKTSTRAGKP